MYLKLFSVTDADQQRLVRSKMSTIFKPSVRWALNLNTSDSSQGIFGGVSNVLKNLEESKKINTLVMSSYLETKTLGSQALSLARRKARSLQLGDPRPRTRKVLKRRPVAVRPKPKKTRAASRRKRTPLRRKKIMTYVSQ